MGCADAGWPVEVLPYWSDRGEQVLMPRRVRSVPGVRGMSILAMLILMLRSRA
jgi:hypothetical protein